MYRNIIILRSKDSARREQEPKLAWRLLPSRSLSSRSKDSARRVKRKNKTTIFWKRVIYSWTRVARNERIEWIGRNESDVRDERNVRNKRDEQIWRNTVFVFHAKRREPPSSRAYRIPDWHFHLLFRPLAKTERKSAKKSGANAPLQNGLTVFKEYFCGCCVRQTIRVSLKANAYCSALPVSEHVRGLSSLTWCVSCYISTSSPICDSQPFFYQAGNDVPQYMPSELHNYSANVNHFCLP